MTSQEYVFRLGLAPQFPPLALLTLAAACRTFDPRLVQGDTVRPPPLRQYANSPAVAGCLVCFVGMTHYGLDTVGEVDEFFARVCRKVDVAMGTPAAIGILLNWWDDTDAYEVRRDLHAWCLSAVTEMGYTIPDRHQGPFPARPPACAAAPPAEPCPF